MSVSSVHLIIGQNFRIQFYVIQNDDLKLLAVFFDSMIKTYLLEPLEVPNPDKMPWVKVKSESLPHSFLVKQLCRFNSWDFKLYMKKTQFGHHICSWKPSTFRLAFLELDSHYTKNERKKWEKWKYSAFKKICDDQPEFLSWVIWNPKR